MHDHFYSTLSLLYLRSFLNDIYCMSPSNPDSKPDSENSSNEEANYLERKYGKEPKITAEEYTRIRWNWH